MTVDTVADERTLREIYLPAFEIAVKEGKPWTVMNAYNRLNGKYCAENDWLLNDVLRKDWGFDGVVVTDWGDLDYVVDGADAVQAGNDVIMPGGPPVIAQVLKGYEEGRVSLEAMREAVCHLMNYLLETKPFREKREA